MSNHARGPHRVTEFADPVEDFLAHACLVYSGDGEHRRERAARVLASRPGLAAESLCAAAALGERRAAEDILRRDPAAASRRSGPFAWEPLLYLAYSRVRQDDPLGVARLLLEHGADPNAGYLWDGLPSPSSC